MTIMQKTHKEKLEKALAKRLSDCFENDKTHSQSLSENNA